jgi:hypothetical protein
MRPIQILPDDIDAPVMRATPSPSVIDTNRIWEAPWPTEMLEKSGQVGVYYQAAMKNEATLNLCRALSVLSELHYKRIAGYMRATNPVKLGLIVASLSQHHDGSGGGYHLTSSGTNCFCDVKLDKVHRRYDPAFTSFIFVAESTQPMAYFNAPSFSDDFDQGEALSRVMAITIMPGQLGPYGVVVKWLNSKSRPDYSNQRTDLYTGGPIGYSMVQLFWMRNKLGIPWERIIAGGKQPGLTMEQIYHAVTGQSGVFKRMMVDINKTYPPGKVLEDTEANETIFV